MATKLPTQLLKKQQCYQEQLTKYTELHYLGRVYCKTRKETANVKSLSSISDLYHLFSCQPLVHTHTHHAAWTQKHTTNFEFPQAHKKH